MTDLDVVSFFDVSSRTPELGGEDQEQLCSELNASVRRVAPVFASGTATVDQLAEARGIVLRALVRMGVVDSWVESSTTGPSGVKFRASAGGSGVLTSADVAALRAVCGDLGAAGGPSGSFPAPGAYGRLFADPRVVWS